MSRQVTIPRWMFWSLIGLLLLHSTLAIARFIVGS